jgi:hypothetical protein
VLAGAFPDRVIHGVGGSMGWGMPPSTAMPWSPKGRRGRRGCHRTRCCTGPSRRPPVGVAGRVRRGTGWARARTSPRPRSGRPSASPPMDRPSPLRPPSSMPCGTDPSKVPLAGSCWSRPLTPPSPTTWRCSPSTAT